MINEKEKRIIEHKILWKIRQWANKKRTEVGYSEKGRAFGAVRDYTKSLIDEK